MKRAPRLSAFALALALPAAHAAPESVAAPLGTGCDLLGTEPVNERVRFETDIQPHIGGLMGTPMYPRCDPCHTILDRGDMQIDPANARLSLLGPDGEGMPSPNYPNYRRVVPGRPDLSLVFLRINCYDAPGAGTRMPPNQDGGVIDPDYLRMQALVHDWIKAGAVMEGGDRIFQSSVESLR